MDKPTIFLYNAEPQFREKLEQASIEGKWKQIIPVGIEQDLTSYLNEEGNSIALLDSKNLPEKEVSSLLLNLKTKKIPLIFVGNKQEFHPNLNGTNQLFGFLSPETNRKDLHSIINKLNFLSTFEEQKQDFENWYATKNRNAFYFIKINNTLEKIRLGDILWVQSEGNYIFVKTEEKKYAIKSSLKKFAEKLPAKLFARIHRSYLVQLEKITKIDSTKNQLFIKHEKLPIGRNYKSRVYEQLPILSLKKSN